MPNLKSGSPFKVQNEVLCGDIRLPSFLIPASLNIVDIPTIINNIVNPTIILEKDIDFCYLENRIIFLNDKYNQLNSNPNGDKVAWACDTSIDTDDFYNTVGFYFLTKMIVN